jgi:hypothetical protein
MKRLLTFALPQVVFESKPLEFKEDSGGYEITAMLFSTAYNRNKAYFQVSDLMKWVNKTESILNDLDHDLTITGGKYFGTKDTKLAKIWHQFTDGDLEIWGTLQTKDPLFVANIDKITAPSIELMVNEEDCICNEFGEYYTQIDWVGIGWLRGMVAGSGNARVTEIKEFNHLSTFNIQQDMTKEEVQELLNAQAETLTATFEARDEALLKKFQEVVETIKTPEPVAPEATPEPTAEVIEPSADPEPTPEELEDQEVLAQVQASLKKAEKREELLKQFSNSKLVANRETDVANVVKSQELPSFYKKLNN